MAGGVIIEKNNNPTLDFAVQDPLLLARIDVDGVYREVFFPQEIEDIQRTGAVGMHHIGSNGFQGLASLAEHGEGRWHPVGEELVYADGQLAEVVEARVGFFGNQRDDGDVEAVEIHVLNDVVHDIDRPFVAQRRYEETNFNHDWIF